MTVGAVVMITRRNALATTGMSWARVLGLAKTHHVAVLQLGPRCTAVAAAPLLAALEATHPSPPPLDDFDRLLVEIGARSA
jgi:hypothetical protein